MPIADVLLPWLSLESDAVVYVERVRKPVPTSSLGSGDVLPWLSLG